MQIKLTLSKSKKFIRYSILIGIEPTLMKNQLHFIKQKSKSDPLICTQKLKNYKNKNKVYGIIGCGYYAFSIGAYFINKFKPRSILEFMIRTVQMQLILQNG